MALKRKLEGFKEIEQFDIETYKDVEGEEITKGLMARHKYAIKRAIVCATFSFLAFVLIYHTFTPSKADPPQLKKSQIRTQADAYDEQLCLGRKIYMYDLPCQFNCDLLQKCKFGLVDWLDFCPHIANLGYGNPLTDGWFQTDSYVLELIFHSRMISYPCLTTNPAAAEAFFIPYYTGYDALKYLYKSAPKQSNPHGLELVNWLRKNAGDQLQRFGGADHFVIMGRTSWDFTPSKSSDWSTGILGLREIANMTALLIEKNPWNSKEMAVPYPTSFHPNRAQLTVWIDRVRSSKRQYLFSIAGGIKLRSDMAESFTTVRNTLFGHCLNSPNCIPVDCTKLKCSHNPIPIKSAFLQSQFCLQPRGDTSTRRSTFDALISGCIPVFFHPDSAYSQYQAHLPVNSSSYSVFIHEDMVADKKLDVEEVLKNYSMDQILVMRKKVISLIPRLIYMIKSEDDRGGLDHVPDAFDVSIEAVLQRIRAMKMG